MRLMLALLMCTFVQVGLFGCKGKIVPVTQRKINVQQEGNMVSRSRPIELPAKPPEIYVKNRVVKIDRVKNRPISGSLYRIDDPRNVLLTEKPRGMIGSFLDVGVMSNRVKIDGVENVPETEKASKKSSNEKPDGGANLSEEDKKAKELEETLLKALPDLDGGKANPVLLKSLKMRVVHKLPNGDALVAFSRDSKNGYEANLINVRARVPQEVLNSKRPITTNDLQDVEWAQVMDGEIANRNSTSWEDEYTLRISGFSEAKSKQALALDEKKKQMRTVRDQLETNLKSMTAQRAKIAQERQKLARERSKMLEQQGMYEEKLKEKDGLLEERNNEINELKEEKQQVETELRDFQKEVEADAADAQKDEKEDKASDE